VLFFLLLLMSWLLYRAYTHRQKSMVRREEK